MGGAGTAICAGLSVGRGSAAFLVGVGLSLGLSRFTPPYDAVEAGCSRKGISDAAKEGGSGVGVEATGADGLTECFAGSSSVGLKGGSGGNVETIGCSGIGAGSSG